MVVKLRVKVDWNDPKEQPVVLYFYRDRIEADTIKPFRYGCHQGEPGHKTISFDDWFLMSKTLNTIMRKD
jgi:hypothetical protein